MKSKLNSLKYTLMVLMAKIMAKFAHSGQRYGNGEPYYKYHVLGVAEGFKDRPEYYITAILHDVIEDSSFTIKDVSSAFGDTIADAVLMLTHLKANDETYDEYIEFIQKMRFSPAGKIAHEVKIADSKFNLRHCQKGSKRAAKYIRVLFTLGEGDYNEVT